jgi:hypothetical protein
MRDLFQGFSRALGQDSPRFVPNSLDANEAVAWFRNKGLDPFPFRLSPAPSDRSPRHRRKYAEGELGADKSFYFKGPEGKLNLRARNLVLFTQLAQGVDDATWLYHLRKGDYSAWFRQVIKDDELASEVEHIERDTSVAPTESRALIKTAIEERYTGPA